MAGCKKEKIEPVEVTPDETNATGKYDQPKFAEITSSSFKHKLDFSYNSQGLVTSINSTIDTLRGTKSEKDYEIKYEYQNDLVLKISFKSYPNAFLEFAEPEPGFNSLEEGEVNYVYEGSVVKQMNVKNNIKIDKTEQYNYVYNLDGYVDYILIKTIAEGNAQLTDSINYIYVTESSTKKVTKERFIKMFSSTPPYGATPQDTGSNGFVRFEQVAVYLFNDLEFSSNNISYSYSKLEKQLQKEVDEVLFGNIGFGKMELPILKKIMKSYFIESKSETSFGTKSRTFEYEYKINDKGQLISCIPKMVGNPFVITSFDWQTIKITY